MRELEVVAHLVFPAYEQRDNTCARCSCGPWRNAAPPAHYAEEWAFALLAMCGATASLLQCELAIGEGVALVETAVLGLGEPPSREHDGVERGASSQPSYPSPRAG
jgi:hypothetical protein